MKAIHFSIKWVIIIPLILIAVFSCKKEENNYTTSSNTNTSSVPKILTESNVSGGTTTTTIYSYNTNGKLSVKAFSNGSYIKYEYESGQITAKTYSNTGILSGTEIFTLNASGFVASSYTTGSNYSYTYEYDANGYLKKQKWYNNSVLMDSAVFTISNGNYITETFTNGYSNYDYITDKNNTVGNENYGMAFSGKQSSNLVQTISTNYLGTPYVTSYTYDYDSKGRVSRRNTVGAPDYTSFTYQE